MEDLKNKIEALLFATGKATSIEEIKRVCKVNDDVLINKALQDLKIDYDNRDSSLSLVNEGERWKIVTKENYFNVVKKVVTETELSKSLMETLAVIAWKYPIKQCDLIKVRTNKAYAHLDELEELGYISRQKFGRTKLIKLTDRFFSYFDLPPEKLKEKFADFNQIAQAITNKEHEIKQLKEDHLQNMEDIKKMQQSEEQKQKEEIEKQTQEIDLIDKQGNKVELEQYETVPETKTIDQRLGLETYESEKEEKPLENIAEEAKPAEESAETEDEKINLYESPEEYSEKQESDESNKSAYQPEKESYNPITKLKDANDQPEDFLDDDQEKISSDSEENPESEKAEEDSEEDKEPIKEQEPESE
jgi:segregation and condensation protein B